MGKNDGREFYPHAQVYPVGFRGDIQVLADLLHPFAPNSADRDNTFPAVGKSIFIIDTVAVLCLLYSEYAVEQAAANAVLNGLQDTVHFRAADVFDELPRLAEAGETYDLVILDPPAFAKSRATIKNAMKGYREINIRGMKLVKDGGYLATCSCSYFMDYENFTKVIRQAAQSAHKRLRQVEYRTQAADHPILWAADESYYLRFYIFQVCEEK